MPRRGRRNTDSPQPEDHDSREEGSLEDPSPDFPEDVARRAAPAEGPGAPAPLLDEEFILEIDDDLFGAAPSPDDLVVLEGGEDFAEPLTGAEVPVPQFKAASQGSSGTERSSVPSWLTHNADELPEAELAPEPAARDRSAEPPRGMQRGTAAGPASSRPAPPPREGLPVSPLEPPPLQLREREPAASSPPPAAAVSRGAGLPQELADGSEPLGRVGQESGGEGLDDDGEDLGLGEGLDGDLQDEMEAELAAAVRPGGNRVGTNLMLSALAAALVVGAGFFGIQLLRSRGEGRLAPPAPAVREVAAVPDAGADPSADPTVTAVPAEAEAPPTVGGSAEMLPGGQETAVAAVPEPPRFEEPPTMPLPPASQDTEAAVLPLEEVEPVLPERVGAEAVPVPDPGGAPAHDEAARGALPDAPAGSDSLPFLSSSAAEQRYEEDAGLQAALGVKRGAEIVIQLENGHVFRGRVKRFRDQRLTLAMQRSEYTFEIGDIVILDASSPEYRSLEQLPPAAVTLANGQRIRGRLVLENEDFVVLGYENGRVAVPRESVRDVVFSGRVHF